MILQAFNVIITDNVQPGIIVDAYRPGLYIVTYCSGHKDRFVVSGLQQEELLGEHAGIVTFNLIVQGMRRLLVQISRMGMQTLL